MTSRQDLPLQPTALADHASSNESSRVGWLVGGAAVVLAGIVVTQVMRSWVHSSDAWEFMGWWEKAPVYCSWFVLVACGAALVYSLAWVALPSLPPHAYEGGLSILPVGRNPTLLDDSCRTGATAEASTGSVDATVVSPEPIAGPGGVRVKAATTNFVSVLGGSVREGAFLTGATEGEAAAVLGARAAVRLGVDRVGAQLRLGTHSITVVGILEPLDALYRDLNESAFVGFGAAGALLGFDGRRDTLYVRRRRPLTARVEHRSQRLRRGLCVAMVCSMAMGLVVWFGKGELNPCERARQFGGWCGDPPLEEGDPIGARPPEVARTGLVVGLVNVVVMPLSPMTDDKGAWMRHTRGRLARQNGLPDPGPDCGPAGRIGGLF